MRLTNKQAEQFRDVGDALQNRTPVLLTGKSNGKSTLMHYALEVLGKRDEMTGGYSTTPAHVENFTIDFHRVYFTNPYTTGVTQIMRQVLTYAKVTATMPHYHADIVVMFEKFLSAAYDQGHIICLAVDNAEMLGKRCFTVLKALNEYYDASRRRSIGCGLIIAGEMKELKKMPMPFMSRCKEVMVGKIDASDIVELISILHPQDVKWFNDESLKRIAKCPDTTTMKSVIDHCVWERKRFRTNGVTANEVESNLAKIAERQYEKDGRLALAA